MEKVRSILEKYKYHIVGFLVMATILIWLPIVGYGGSGLKAWFFDVGQGDAEFLDFFDGNQVLIDGGPNGDILQKLGKAMPFYDKSIDLVILTHPHKDHIFGLIEVLKRYDVDKIILPNVDFKSSFYDEFLKEAKSDNVVFEYFDEGDVVKIGDFAELDFLSPKSKDGDGYGFDEDAESFGLDGQQLNDESLVFKLVFGDGSVLFTGDSGVDVEGRIVSEKYDLRADVLKVGHHGSRYSSSEDFLRLVDPKYAVIEVGANNRYGHPAEQTLSRLSNIGTRILRTDTDGDILFYTDGKNIILEE